MAPERAAFSVRGLLAAAAFIGIVLAAMAAQPLLAQSTSGVLPLDSITSIPTPMPVTIRPRVFTAYGTLIAAAMLSILYLYRGRTFILYWLGSFLLLAGALGLMAWFTDPAPGLAATSVALLLLTLSAGMLRLAADAFPQKRVEWRTPLKAAVLLAAGFAIAAVALPSRTFINGAMLLTAALLGWAAARYVGVARHGRHLGAAIIALGLCVISAGTAAAVLIALEITPDGGLVNRLAVSNVITSLFVALGMLLMVFEELTDELRRANQDLADANDAARRLSITDPLTGCHNRRFFEEIERREMKRHRRYGVPLSVVFIDVNRLKQLNDSEGHERGDDALRAIGAMLRREVRQSDYVIRWGGDEFLLLLTCSLSVAENKATSLKESFLVEREMADLPDRIGLSIGVAAVGPEADDLQGAIRDADAAMYRDKLGERTSLQVR